MPLGSPLQPANHGPRQKQAQAKRTITMQQQGNMHKNSAIYQGRCADVPEKGLMRETLVQLFLPQSLP
ncbi:MAG: hypothetical protein CMQ69_05110 [Gammaproteobacteria bacterium]|nr:hypothetical protein [Gammaproteobacteria bacterium]